MDKLVTYYRWCTTCLHGVQRLGGAGKWNIYSDSTPCGIWSSDIHIDGIPSRRQGSLLIIFETFTYLAKATLAQQWEFFAQLWNIRNYMYTVKLYNRVLVQCWLQYIKQTSMSCQLYQPLCIVYPTSPCSLEC